MAGADEDAAVARAQREHVAGPHEVFGSGVGVHQDLNRAGAIRGRDASGDAGASFDTDSESSAKGSSVLANHGVEAEQVESNAIHGHADQSAGASGHEVDRVGGDELSGQGEIALVLAVFVIGDDQHLAVTERLDCLFDGAEGRLTSSRRATFGRRSAGTSSGIRAASGVVVAVGGWVRGGLGVSHGFHLRRGQAAVGRGDPVQLLWRSSVRPHSARECRFRG